MKINYSENKQSHNPNIEDMTCPFLAKIETGEIVYVRYFTNASVDMGSPSRRYHGIILSNVDQRMMQPLEDIFSHRLKPLLVGFEVHLIFTQD